MMKAYKLFTFIYTLVIVLTLSSFSGKDIVYDNKSGWIPSDFDSRKSTLLVQNFDGEDHDHSNYRLKEYAKITDKMKQVMIETYKYKYEFASKEEIEKSDKYANKDEYRYVLTCDNSNYSPHNVGGRFGGASGFSSTNWDRESSTYSANTFHIYDRKLDKHYPTTGKSTAYVATTMKPTVAAIMKFLRAIKE